MSDRKNRKISRHSIHGKIDISALTTLLLFLTRCLGAAPLLNDILHNDSYKGKLTGCGFSGGSIPWDRWMRWSMQVFSYIPEYKHAPNSALGKLLGKYLSGKHTKRSALWVKMGQSWWSYAKTMDSSGQPTTINPSSKGLFLKYTNSWKHPNFWITVLKLEYCTYLKKNQKHFPKWLALSARISCFIDEEMSNGTRNNGRLSWTAQAYFFLRHSLHNAGNGFICFLVFLIKWKTLKEKVFLSYFTFIFRLFVFRKFYFP